MKKSILLLPILFCLIACKKEIKYVYNLPEETGDGWTISSLEVSNVDTLLITQLISKIHSKHFENIDALLIIKDGKLILDEYFNGFSQNKKHKVWSCTKSFSSALIGIAIEKGLIKSEKDSLVSYLGDYSTLRNEHIESITIENLLEMGTGFEWNGDLSESGRKMPYSSDMVEYAIKLPKVAEPGSTFQYNSANSMILAAVIFNATGQQAHDFARTNLFGKLGIVNYEWNKQSEFWTKTAGDEVPAKKPDIDYKDDYAELTNTATGLWLLPRDLAKFGQLYLDGGVWQGGRVLPASWIKKSITEQIPDSNYGLHWKLMKVGKYQSFYASGFGLQRIIVIPELEMVIVFTQNWYHDQPEGNKQMMKILNEFLIKAIRRA